MVSRQHLFFYLLKLLFNVFTYRCKKVSGNQHTEPPHLEKVPMSQPVHSIWAMGITPANHFRRALSVDEIQRLRRLRSDGSPELLSRS